MGEANFYYFTCLKCLKLKNRLHLHVSCRQDLKFIKMRYVAAYLLASLGGSQPSSGDIEKILGSVGIEIDDDRLKQVMSSLSGKDLAEVIEAGRARLGSVPTGGGAAAASAAAAADAAPAAAVEEEKKEEEKKAASDDESSDDDMGFGLFD